MRVLEMAVVVDVVVAVILRAGRIVARLWGRSSRSCDLLSCFLGIRGLDSRRRHRGKHVSRAPGEVQYIPGGVHLLLCDL